MSASPTPNARPKLLGADTHNAQIIGSDTHAADLTGDVIASFTLLDFIFPDEPSGSFDDFVNVQPGDEFELFNTILPNMSKSLNLIHVKAQQTMDIFPNIGFLRASINLQIRLDDPITGPILLTGNTIQLLDGNETTLVVEGNINNLSSGVHTFYYNVFVSATIGNNINLDYRVYNISWDSLTIIEIDDTHTAELSGTNTQLPQLNGENNSRTHEGEIIL